MEEVVASMTVTIRADWINWMKGLDNSEDWKKFLNDFCTEQLIDKRDDGNVIHLTGNFEAIKDVRRNLQDAAKQASEKMKIYEHSASTGGITGLEEKFDQMKIADPEGTEKKEDTKQKRIRILKHPELSAGEKPGDIIGSDGVGSDKQDRHDSISNLIQMQVNQNQSTESQEWELKLLSSDEMMSKNTEQPANNLLHVNQKKTDSGQGEPQGHQQQMTSTDCKLSDEVTPKFQRQIPQIHTSPCPGQMQLPIYPLLSQEQSAANAGHMLQPTCTFSDEGQRPGHQGQTKPHGYPSQGQGLVIGHQGQTEYHGYPSQGQGLVTGHQGQTEYHGYPSQGQGLVTGHQGQTEPHGYPSQGQGLVTGHQAQTEPHGYPSQGQGLVTGHQGQTKPHGYPSQGQGLVTGHQGQTEPHGYPSQGQGLVTGHQGQTERHGYPSQGQGLVTGHQAQIQHPSYSSHVSGNQGIMQPFANPITPGQGQIFQPSPLPFMYKQFLIKHYADDSLHFTSNRTTNVLNIFVHKGNIVDQRTQILVSSANCQLTRHGNVSEAILTAAGQSIVDECSQIIRSTVHGYLPFGTVIPTKAGNLGRHVETILHAIIPTPQEFQINQQLAFNLLSQVFFSCLCMSAEHAKSVSFPAIGSEIFGLQRMVEAFTCGLRTFDQRCASSWPFSLKGEIHFISKDPNKLKTILSTLLPLIA